MDIAEVINVAGSQAVKLPLGYHLHSPEVTIRREGDSLILAPIRLNEWPADFFESIRISDECFARPEQGQMPSPPTLD